MKQQDDWRLTDEVHHEAGRGDPFAAAIRGTRMPMVITDPRLADNPIVFANKSFQTLTGYDREEIIGRNCRFLQGPGTDHNAVRAIRGAVDAGEDIQIDILNYRKDGSTFWNALFLSPVRGHDGEIQFFFASQLDVTDRIEAHREIADQKADVDRLVAERTAELELALEAKTLLLHEVDHRVKNNLTMIGSLLRLQARTLPDPDLKATLESMLERVDALATVHRRLYQSDDITRFDIGALVETLALDLVGAAGRKDIVLELETACVMAPSSLASALGLIINELLTNALKHAFCDGRPGRLRVAVTASGGLGRIIVADDGPNARTDGQPGLGRSLIGRLSRQIGGETRWTASDKGMTATIDFPVGGS
ncbi:histidine kinase dimerization/phosphoacceptor domain -containing protein [Caulobacter segnis]|nr:histidine kinase dimerization/phosphoacceptor domain -containing protein [Caulobacter segnis]MDG2520543.1 histidine kinase dimerization/phosphoacceptor domain -containing protein [Caulobacter segnis]